MERDWTAIERGVARLEKMADWVAEHKDDISDWIDSAVKAIYSFVTALDRAAEAVGGWKNVLIALAALKVLTMVASLIQLAGAIGSIGAALGLIGGGTAAAGILATIGAAAAPAALAVGALALAVVGMAAALKAMDSDVDEKNHRDDGDDSPRDFGERLRRLVGWAARERLSLQQHGPDGSRP